MPNLNYDIIRVEDTEANLPTTLIAGQLGFATDTNKLGHLMLDGITMQWYQSTEDSWIYWTSTGWGGVTTDTPDGKFHIYSSSAGSVTADIEINDLVVENGDNCGITLLSPDASNTVIAFGSPSDNNGVELKWNYDSNKFYIDTYKSGAHIEIDTAGSGGIFLNANTGIGFTSSSAASETLEVFGKIKTHWHIYHSDDDFKHYWGEALDCSITYNGTNMVFNSQEVGTGDFIFSNGDILQNADNQKHFWGGGNDCSITYDGSDMLFNSQETGSGDFLFSNGSVGINTTAATCPLQINHTGSDTTALSIGDWSTLSNNTGIYLRTSGTAYFGTHGGTGDLRITCDNFGTGANGITVVNGGNTGINSSSPGNALDIVGTVNVSTLTASRIVTTNASKDLVSLSPSSAYTPTNVSTDRSFNADTVAIAELADVVGTLIADLQTANILG
jgi:hypothetical protein